MEEGLTPTHLDARVTASDDRPETGQQGHAARQDVFGSDGVVHQAMAVHGGQGRPDASPHGDGLCQ
ncbi:hypothetical protein GCM10027590_25040 [Nocardiopsis nanhaiensis]